jgi:type I restriction enzyme, S subunit
MKILFLKELLKIKNKMTQQTQTKQLPLGWKEEGLGNVAQWGSGGTPLSSKNEYYGGDIKWAIIGDLNEGILVETQKRITKEGLENSSAKLVPKGTLLVGMYGSIGKTAITGCEMATNQAIAFALPKKEITDLKFLKYFINLNVSTLFRLSKGDTQKNISQEVLKKVKIPLPPLPTQSGIVSAIETQFTRLDAAVKSLKNLKQKIELYRKAILKKAFEKKDGWEELQIRDISEKIQYGLTSQSSLNYNGPKYLRITDIQNGKVNWEQVPNAKEKEKINDYILNKDDLVFARTGATVGKSFLIKECPKNSVFASYLIRIVPDKKKIFPDLLYYYFQSPMYWELISQKQLGIGQPNVNGTILSKLPISIPPFQEQSAIVQSIESKFSIIDKVEQAVDNSLKKAEMLRKSILKSAFEGRLVRG